MVLIGDGKMTSFWWDLWCGYSTLADTFPALFGHVMRPNAYVAWVLSLQELRLAFCPCLSNAASRELEEHQALVSPTHLDEDDLDTSVSAQLVATLDKGALCAMF